MAADPPDPRSTRWLRRRPTQPLPHPQPPSPSQPQPQPPSPSQSPPFEPQPPPYGEPPTSGEPPRRPRFDRPPPSADGWYGAPPERAPRDPTWPPVGDEPRAPWLPPERQFPPGPPPRRPRPRRPFPPIRPDDGRRGRPGRRDHVGRRPRRRLLRRIVRLLAALAVVQALVVLSLRWVDPPTTAFMAANPEGSIQESVPVEHVSRNVLAAVIAHEDAALPYRSGAFEWGQLWSRAYAHVTGEEDPAGSTIPQQVTKNLFLNQEMTAWRKAVEAGLAVELAAVVDDRRMLELYVNYAQFGPTIYGVCAAGWYYFDSPPGELSVGQAVQLVGLLPSPGHVRRAPGGGLDFQVEDGLGWLSRSHVLNAQARVPPHLERLGFQPVEDAGVAGLASEQEPSDDDCSSPPEEVTELIAAEGTG